jgi:hypothetical protein
VSDWESFRASWHGTVGDRCHACGQARAGWRTCADDQCRREAAEAHSEEQRHTALARALTAQAWAVACVVFCEVGSDASLSFGDLGYSEQGLARKIAMARAPADLATEILGGEP